MYIALGLFMVNGYSATTVDDILRATGLTRRTFFRYFAGKDDIVLSNVRDHQQALAAEIVSRPAEEAPLTAIYHAILAVSRRQAHFESSRGLALLRLIEETAELRARRTEREHGMTPAIAEAIARRERETVPSARALLAAHVARALLDASNQAWLAANGSISRATAVEETFRELVHLMPAE
jgi:AcrR family transcriptional regulator